MPDLCRVTGKIYHTVIIGAPAKLARHFFGLPLYQNTLSRANHASADGSRLLLDFFLQALQPLKLDLIRRSVRQVRGGRAGARAINEAE